MGMNPERKAQWVAALRSGEFPQGQSELKTAEGEFCCLGVACELAYREGKLNFGEVASDEEDNGHKRVYGDVDDYLENVSSNEWSWSDLPVGARNWLGLGEMDNDPVVRVIQTHPKYASLESWTNGGTNTLFRVSILNDSGFTFDEIADLIEEQL